eukprot:1695650-Pleurochrysis_carterae.AAC.1
MVSREPVITCSPSGDTHTESTGNRCHTNDRTCTHSARGLTRAQPRQPSLTYRTHHQKQLRPQSDR